MEMEFFFQLTPDRLVMKMQSLYSLIALAYASSCPAPNTLSGGMDWMRTENYELQATIPAGTPRYTKEQLLSGNAPRLQRMLQNLLTDRFKLVLKRELKEMQGYNLVLAQPGKLKPSGDQTPDQPPPTPGRGGGIRQVRGPIIPSMAAPISRLVSMLQRTMSSPIVDKTGLTGLYDIFLEFPEIGNTARRWHAASESPTRRGPTAGTCQRRTPHKTRGNDRIETSTCKGSHRSSRDRER
jgi:uncharacterized protein (TIGR03435 family)